MAKYEDDPDLLFVKYNYKLEFELMELWLFWMFPILYTTNVGKDKSTFGARRLEPRVSCNQGRFLTVDLSPLHFLE